MFECPFHRSVLSGGWLMLIGLFFLCGCGKTEGEIPEFKRMECLENALTQVLAGNDMAAAESFSVLQALDPDNDYLEKCERLMRANAVLSEAERLVVEGRLAGARAVIQHDIRQNGRTPNLVETEAALGDLIAIRALIGESRRATSVDTLTGVIARLRQVMSDRPELSDELRLILSERLIHLRQLIRAEESKMFLDLWFDTDAAIAASSSTAPLWLAELQVQAPHLGRFYSKVNPEPVISPRSAGAVSR